MLPVQGQHFGIQETKTTALLVIQIMPVKYSIVKDQTPSLLRCYFEDTENRLSVYGKTTFGFFVPLILCWWAWIDSNYRPHPYQGCALAT